MPALHCWKPQNCRSSPLKLAQVAGSEIEMKNFTNPADWANRALTNPALNPHTRVCGVFHLCFLLAMRCSRRHITMNIPNYLTKNARSKPQERLEMLEWYPRARHLGGAARQRERNLFMYLCITVAVENQDEKPLVFHGNKIGVRSI